MKFVLGLKKLLSPEKEWSAFLAGKKPQTAARYERERRRAFKMLSAGNLDFSAPKPKGRKELYSSYVLADRRFKRDEVYVVLKQAAEKVDARLRERKGKGKKVFHSFTAKVELPDGFFYVIRVPMFRDPEKAMRALEDRLVRFVDEYSQMRFREFKVSGIRYYQIPEGYRYR